MFCFLLVIHHNYRLLILASAQTYLICPDRVTSETKAFTPQCKLRQFDHNMPTTAYLTMIRIESFAVPASWIQCVLSKIFVISLRYFNQLDATSKVMYRHEIICTGNTALSNSQLFVFEQCSGCLVLKNL